MGGSKTTVIDETSTTSNQYDPVYNKGLLDISKRQQDLAEKSFEQYQSTFWPYEKEKMAFNMRDMTSQDRLRPQREELQAASMKEMLYDISAGREYNDELRTQRLEELKASRGVMGKFFKEAEEGVNVEGRVGQATSDVAGAFANQTGQDRRAAARMGINPNSGRFGGASRRNAIDRSKAIATARTTARDAAEAENWQRLGTGMGVRSGLSGGSPVATGAVLGSGAKPGQGMVGGISNPSQLGSQMFSQAGAGYGVLASQVQGSTSTTHGTKTVPGASPWEIIGGVVGTGLGVALG